MLPELPEQAQFKNNWTLVADKHEAHKSCVNALASLGPHLYSGATKSLKIWDTLTM